jgi:hypothetical protein
MKKQNDPTIAQVIFKDKDIITSRPEGMSTEEYKLHRRIQKRVIKDLFRKPSNPKIANAMGIKFKYNSH